MANYQLRTPTSLLVDVPASSSLDGTRRRSRRGSIVRTLGTLVVQYMETPVVGDERLEWRIPFANGSQRGVLQSASDGTYGDELTLRSPKYGDILVAFAPGADGYEETLLEPDVGYQITCRFVRLL